MQKQSIFTITKGTKTVIIAMAVLVFIGITIAYFYYNGINEAEDPRVLDAKFQYKAYNDFAAQNNYTAVFATLDTIEAIYTACPDYVNSYEMGVVYNNRTAVWTTAALFEHVNQADKQAKLDSAYKNSVKSVAIYTNWLSEYGELAKEDILVKITPFFSEYNEMFEGENLPAIINKRADEIVLSQKESLKRISVAYTNLGVVQRHKEDYDAAMESYKQALRYWRGNRSAKNNINVLLGRPIEDPSILERMFPEEFDKNYSEE